MDHDCEDDDGRDYDDDAGNGDCDYDNYDDGCD